MAGEACTALKAAPGSHQTSDFVGSQVAASQQAKAIIVRILSSHPFEGSVGSNAGGNELEYRRKAAIS
jgi:hypothetical protein